MNPTNLYHLIWTLLTPDMIFASLLQNLEKQIKKNQISNQAQQLGAPGLVHPEALIVGVHGQRDPMRQTHRIGVWLDRRQTRRP